MLQIQTKLKQVWDYASGEQAEAEKVNEANNRPEPHEVEVDGRYISSDRNVNKAKEKSIHDRKVDDLDKAAHQIEFINKINSATSTTELNWLKNQINNEGFDKHNLDILNKFLSERLGELQ